MHQHMLSPTAGLKGFANSFFGFLGCPIFAEDLVFEHFSIILLHFFSCPIHNQQKWFSTFSLPSESGNEIERNILPTHVKHN